MKRRRPTTLEPISAAMIVVVSLHLALAFGVWWWWHDYGSVQSMKNANRLSWLSPADFHSTLPADAVPPAAKAVLAAVKPARQKAAQPAPPKPVAEEPVQKATLVAAPAEVHRMEPVANNSTTPLFASGLAVAKPAANRSITLRRLREKAEIPSGMRGGPAPPLTSTTLLDIARLNRMRSPQVAIPATALNGVNDDEGLDAVDDALNTAFLEAWTAPPIDDVPPTQREARLNVSIGKDGKILRSQMTKFSRSHVLDQSILEAAAAVKKISATLPSNFAKESYDLELNFLLLP